MPILSAKDRGLRVGTCCGFINKSYSFLRPSSLNPFR
nr:MAG TPA: hypothetical protein [Bacteriophage sp.]